MGTPAAVLALKKKAASPFEGNRVATMPHDLTPDEKGDVLNVLLAAGQVEDALAFALTRSIRTKNREMKDKLFAFNGPLGTFSSKIAMAFAMGLIGEEDHSRCEGLRELRNAFAHARRGLSFEDDDVQTIIVDMLHFAQKITPLSAAQLRTEFSIMAFLLVGQIMKLDDQAAELSGSEASGAGADSASSAPSSSAS